MGDTFQPDILITDQGRSLFPNEARLRSGTVAYQLDTGNYWVDYIPGGQALAITFEPAGLKKSHERLRDGWGVSFLLKRNYSVLAIKYKASDWYRRDDLHVFFRSAAFVAFAGRFKDVTFMGGSMGGYAALVFSEMVPNARVIAHNPQTTLDRRVVPWDRRFPTGTRQNWDGDFADAGAQAASARRIYITYDPFDEKDRRHVERLRSHDITHLKVPFVGHATPIWLLEMNILTKVTDMALADQLNSESFAKVARARRSIPQYYRILFNVVTKKSYKDFVLQKGLTAFPDSEMLLYLASIRHFHARRYEDCIELYRKLVNAALPKARLGELRAFAGIALFRTHKMNAEVEEIFAAIDYKSRHVDELITTGKFLIEIGKYHRSAAISKRAVDIAPTRVGGYLNLAISQKRLNKPDAALATLKRAEAMCPAAGAQIKKFIKAL